MELVLDHKSRAMEENQHWAFGIGFFQSAKINETSTAVCK